MYHNQEQQNAFEGEECPSAYECYQQQWGKVEGKWADLEGVLWLAMIGATEHVAQKQCTHREYLQMMDRLMALAGQLPACMADQFREVWDDAFPTMKGRY